MRLLALFALVFSLSSFARAEDKAPVPTASPAPATTPAPTSVAQPAGDEFKAPLDAGHLLVNGSLYYDKVGDDYYLFVAPTVEYFVVKGLSLGATANFNWSDDHSRRRFGPSLHYYFFSCGRAAPYFT